MPEKKTMPKKFVSDKRSSLVAKSSNQTTSFFVAFLSDKIGDKDFFGNYFGCFPRTK